MKENASFKSEVGAIHPENFLRRFMSGIGMSNADMVSAVALANAALPQEGPGAEEHKPWHGRSPVSVAGAIMYIIANLPRASKKPPLEDISAVCGVAEATIRGVYRDMAPYLVGPFVA